MDEKSICEVKKMLENKVQEEVAGLLGEKVDAIVELLSIQEGVCNCGSEYQIGLYNGLAIGLSVLTGKEPEFYCIKEGGNGNGISEQELCCR